MLLNIKSYSAPQTLEQLWQMLEQIQETPLFFSGGIELFLRLRDHEFDVDRPLIDLTMIEELNGIKSVEGGLWIGASTTCSQLAENVLLREYASALVQAAQQSGAWQIRNRSTLGEKVSRGGMEADILPALYALDARIVCNDGKQERQFDCEDFYLGPQRTVLHEREIVTGVLLPISVDRKSIFLKIKSRTMRSLAKVSVAVSLRVHNQQYTETRIALGAVGPTVMRATSAEGLLEGQPVARAPLERVADEVRRTAHPNTDLRSSARYRKWSIGILAIRALQQITPQYQPQSSNGLALTPPPPSSLKPNTAPATPVPKAPQTPVPPTSDNSQTPKEPTSAPKATGEQI